MREASIIEEHVFNLGLCVPKAWSNDEIEKWINKVYRASLDCQWHFDREVGECEQHTGFKHVWVSF